MTDSLYITIYIVGNQTNICSRNWRKLYKIFFSIVNIEILNSELQLILYIELPNFQFKFKILC